MSIEKQHKIIKKARFSSFFNANYAVFKLFSNKMRRLGQLHLYILFSSDPDKKESVPAVQNMPTSAKNWRKGPELQEN